MDFKDVGAKKRLVALLVEDDQNDVVLIRRAVQRHGLVERLLIVSSGEETIAYLEGDLRYANRQEYPFPDVIVLDQFMPRWSGLDVLLWLRNSPRFEHLPVVILSLGLSPAQRETAQLLRAAYCSKTAQLGELREAMEHAMTLAHAGSARLRQQIPVADAHSANAAVNRARAV